MTEHRFFASYSPPPRPRQLSRRHVVGSHSHHGVVSLSGAATPKRPTPAPAVAALSNPMLVGTIHLEHAQHLPDRKALQQALQESQATLCAEARRAGAAEALLRERTATLAAVATAKRREHRDDSTLSLGLGSSKSPRMRLRSCSSSTSSVRSDIQSELQCALSVRDRLAEKLTTAEREAQSLRSSEVELRAKAEHEVQEAQSLRVHIESSERLHAELRRQQSEMRQELEQARAERDQLAKTVEEGVTRQSLHQTDLAQLSCQLEVLKNELDVQRSLLDSASDQAKRLSQDKHELQVTFRSYQEHHGLSDQQQLQVIASLSQKVDLLTKQIECAEMELGAEQGSTAELQGRNASLKQQLSVAEARRIELHNTIQELKGNIRVCCRVRPAAPGCEVALFHPEPNKTCLNHGMDNYVFNFDRVFTAAADQSEVFSEVSGLVQSALDGYKVCIFAYGQTGSGKTYTMQGADEPGREGLIPRAVDLMFRAAGDQRQRGWEWNVKVSIMEVYNESLRDLLRGSGDAAAGPTDGHVITQHSDWGIMVTGMSCIEVDSIDRMKTLMARATRQRSVGATDANETSSRSHLVCSLYLKGTNQLLDLQVNGALHFVDLAGSERVNKSGSTGDRLKETKSINRSLSSLADVFAAKAEGRAHVPFRNSKLTHLMEPCLSGHGKTLMLVGVQAERENTHETLCSMRFARQVSQCSTCGRPRRSAKNLAPPPGSARSMVTSNSAQLPLEKAGTQASVPRRATSMDLTVEQRTTRSRKAHSRNCADALGHSAESYDRSARGASRPLTGREMKRSSCDARLDMIGWKS